MHAVSFQYYARVSLRRTLSGYVAWTGEWMNDVANNYDVDHINMQRHVFCVFGWTAARSSFRRTKCNNIDGGVAKLCCDNWYEYKHNRTAAITKRTGEVIIQLVAICRIHMNMDDGLIPLNTYNLLILIISISDDFY